MTRTVLLAAALFAGAAHAQHHSPYAGQHEREIKSLSDEQTKQYLSGAGVIGRIKTESLAGRAGLN